MRKSARGNPESQNENNRVKGNPGRGKEERIEKDERELNHREGGGGIRRLKESEKRERLKREGGNKWTT